MASALFGLSRALAARSAAIPRYAVRARPALRAQTPTSVAGVRFYRGEELERRMRTLLIHNVPWEMTLEEVEQELQPFRGFEKVEPIEDKDGILFSDKNTKAHARKIFLKIAWQGRPIIPVSEYTDEEPPKPSRSVYVSGIPRNAKHSELNELFRGLEGQVKIKVPKSQMWDGYIGFATVLFESVEQATAAMEVLNERWIGDSKVWVNYSRLPPPREKRARNAERVKNPKKEEERREAARLEKEEKELKVNEIKEMAAEARARRKAREEGMSADGARDRREDIIGGAYGRLQAREQALRRDAGASRQDEGPDSEGPQPGVLAEFMGVTDAKGDRPATSAKDGPSDGAAAVAQGQAGKEAVASANKSDSTNEPSETRSYASDPLLAMGRELDKEQASRRTAAKARYQTKDEVSKRSAAKARNQTKGDASKMLSAEAVAEAMETSASPSDALAAEASNETKDETSERSAAKAVDEASDRIAAARARWQAKAEAETGEKAGEATDKPSETESVKEETTEAKDKSN